tara:strand:+ start:121 stop:492 length:372 start_codon:yes stop_codon:yes gene_type:complete
MAIQRVAQIALAGGLLIAGIAAFKGCQQTARLNRPVATEGIPEGHEYLMRTDTGSDFYTKLKSSNYSVREITAHRIDATGKASSDLNFNVDCYGNQVAIGQLGSGWVPIEPGSVGEALAKRYC